MASTNKTKILFKTDTVENWQDQEANFQTLKGELYFYNDAIDIKKSNSAGEKIFKPRLKIGTGSSTLAEINFLGNDYLQNSDINNIFNQINNKVPLSTTADGVTIYNGTGYKNGYRIRSAGGEGATSKGTCTGFIPVKGGDIIRISGCEFNVSANENAINVSNSSFSNIGQFTMIGAQYDLFNGAYSSYGYSSVTEEKEGVWRWTVPPTESGVAYIRVSGYTASGGNGAALIVTINKPIIT